MTANTDEALSMSRIALRVSVCAVAIVVSILAFYALTYVLGGGRL